MIAGSEPHAAENGRWLRQGRLLKGFYLRGKDAEGCISVLVAV